MQMILQAKQLHLDILEVRTGCAVLSNRLVRLDNPMLRSRLANVEAAVRAAEAVALPAPTPAPN